MEGLFLIFKFENGRFVLKRIIKCGTAFLLVLVLCLCLLPTTAFAASKQVYIWNFPLSDDTLRTSGKWGHGALNLRFGYHVAAGNYTQFRCLDSWQGEVAYCIEPGVPQKNYDSLTDHDDTWWDRMTLPAGHPLTPREVQRLIGRVMSYGYHGSIGGGWWADVEATAEKMAWAYTGKVTGVFDLNFDKREFSAVHTIEGWKTWAMQDVSTAVYRAAQKQLVSGDVMLQKLLECLNGKGITSAGHLSARNFSFGEEIIESDGKLNFYLQADFDVDAAFGTFVCTDQNDDWLNIYANYDIEKGRPCDTLELNLCKGDGTEENWSYHLNAAEQRVQNRHQQPLQEVQKSKSYHLHLQ